MCVEYHTVLYEWLSAFGLWLASIWGDPRYCVGCFIVNTFIKCTTHMDTWYVLGIFSSFYKYTSSQGEFNLPQQFSMKV